MCIICFHNLIYILSKPIPILILFSFQRGCHILVATPGRLLDFTRRGRIKYSSLRFMVLDEADRMLDMGFLGDIETVMNHESMVSSVNYH